MVFYTICRILSILFVVNLFIVYTICRINLYHLSFFIYTICRMQSIPFVVNNYTICRKKKLSFHWILISYNLSNYITFDKLKKQEKQSIEKFFFF